MLLRPKPTLVLLGTFLLLTCTTSPVTCGFFSALANTGANLVTSVASGAGSVVKGSLYGAAGIVKTAASVAGGVAQTATSGTSSLLRGTLGLAGSTLNAVGSGTGAVLDTFVPYSGTALKGVLGGVSHGLNAVGAGAGQVIDYAGLGSNLVISNTGGLSGDLLNVVGAGTADLLPGALTILFNTTKFAFTRDDGTLAYMDFSSAPPSSTTAKGVYYYLHTKENVDDPVELFVDADNAAKIEYNLPKFNKSAPWKIMSHGFQSSSKNPFPNEMMQVFLNQTNEETPNVITVDWSEIASNPYYPYVAGETEYVGNVTADLITNLMQQNVLIDLKRVHFLGHSLGSHVAGYAGAALQERGIGKLARITGLDPAGPTFCVDAFRRLDPNDADFVDAIHTNTGEYCGSLFTAAVDLSRSRFGREEPLAQVDFYPNGGELQPGCATAFTSCSHSRAYYLFQETIINPTAFLAHQCVNWGNFTEGACDTSETAYMGEFVPLTTRGIFYLRTAATSPYAAI